MEHNRGAGFLAEGTWVKIEKEELGPICIFSSVIFNQLTLSATVSAVIYKVCFHRFHSRTLSHSGQIPSPREPIRGRPSSLFICPPPRANGCIERASSQRHRARFLISPSPSFSVKERQFSRSPPDLFAFDRGSFSPQSPQVVGPPCEQIS